VENAYDETALVEAALPGNFEPVEERLLALARHWLPRLPWREADLLILDEIGKEISGSGMDTNVVGRKRAFPRKEPEGQPQMRFIFVRGLSAHTHGNAAGIGLADFTTTRLVRATDYPSTVLNCLTSGYPEGANLPVHLDSDREVIDAALALLGARLTGRAHPAHPQHARRGGSGGVRALPGAGRPADGLHGRERAIRAELRRPREPCGPGVAHHLALFARGEFRRGARQGRLRDTPPRAVDVEGWAEG